MNKLDLRSKENEIFNGGWLRKYMELCKSISQDEI